MIYSELYDQSYRTISQYTDKDKAIAHAKMVGGGKFSTVMLTARSSKDTRVYFQSELTRTRPELVDGVPGGTYLARLLADMGVSVWIWYFVHYWNTYENMYDPPLPEWNVNALPGFGTTHVNFAIPEMRQKIADHVVDLVNCNPAISGVQLDYLRAKDKVFDRDDLPFTAEHITETARLIRAGIGPDKKLTAYFSGQGESVTRRQRRDPWTWLSEEGLFDELQMGSYTRKPIDFRHEWLMSLPYNAKVLPGIATRGKDGTEPFDLLKQHVTRWNELGRTNFAFFDTSTLTQEMVDWLPEVGPGAEPPPWFPNWEHIAELHREIAKEYTPPSG